jgi:hypothetical protein
VLIRTDKGEKLYAATLSAGAVQEKAVSEKGFSLAKRLAAAKVQHFESKSKEMNISGIVR